MKSWKTSLAGLAGGLILAFGPSVGGRLSGDPTPPPITFQNYGPAIALAVLGLLGKDYDKTNAARQAPTQKAVVTDDNPPASQTPGFPGTR